METSFNVLFEAFAVRLMPELMSVTVAQTVVGRNSVWMSSELVVYQSILVGICSLSIPKSESLISVASSDPLTSAFRS